MAELIEDMPDAQSGLAGYNPFDKMAFNGMKEYYTGRCADTTTKYNAVEKMDSDLTSDAKESLLGIASVKA